MFTGRNFFEKFARTSACLPCDVSQDPSGKVFRKLVHMIVLNGYCLTSSEQKNRTFFRVGGRDFESHRFRIFLQTSEFSGHLVSAAPPGEALFRKKSYLKNIRFIFCDLLRLESQCSLSRHTGRVCSRCFRAGRSCLLPALFTPQTRTCAEGLPAFSGGRRSP